MIKQYNDEVIDVAVKYAGPEMLADAASDGVDVYADIPASFDNQMRALIRRKAAGRRAKTALKIAARVAAVLAVVMIISTAVIYSSEALRVRVMNLLYVEKEGCTEITFSNELGVQTPKGMVLPKFIPSGFKLAEAKSEGDGIMIISLYENEAGHMIRVQQLPLNSSIGVNNDNAYETQVAGRAAYVSEHGDESTVVFSNDWNCFIISGKAPAEDLLTMAESMLE